MDFQINYSELVKSIDHWNEYRVPILRISHPDKSLNFRGAMRFYFQDAGQKVATKCVNVTSSDTTKEVIDVLIEKFRPDMRMLSVPEYGLYEIHENGDERKLEMNERPLLVQLEWNKDDREGRFLLRRMDEKTRDFVTSNEEPSLKRKSSKKEKKKHEKLLKQQQKEQEKAVAAANKLASKQSKNGIAERLYNELPETSFTRSISNPEAVMKRRRAQKLEKRLQEFSLEGGQEAGGTLRIFGETINKDVSYKTLLLSTKDTANYVVKQILEKYGKENEDPNDYCLVQLIVPPSATTGTGDNNSLHDSNAASGLIESILNDFDCPLLINQNHDESKGILTFHIRQKPADFKNRREKKPPRSQMQGNTLHPLVVQQLNQRLQINNNHEQYSNQNSPQAGSQTSGSLNHDINNPPPPSFDNIHNVPSLFNQTNGNVPLNPQQVMNHHGPPQNSMSAAFLPHTRMGHPDINGSLQRQNYSQPNIYPVQAIPNGHSVSQDQPVPPQYNHVANDQILPALIQVREEVEDIFLNHVITHINPANVVHRLAPTYVLYMVSRYRASTLFHPELQAPSRAELFVPFTRKIASMIRATIEMHQDNSLYMAFWLANSSDLNHFYKQDKHLSHFTLDAQEILCDSVRASFRYLLNRKQIELDEVLHSFLDERDDEEARNHHQRTGGSNKPYEVTSINQTIFVLDQTLETVRKNRVNAAFTIQIFSHLFHHISRWLFDRLIGVHDRKNNLIPGRQPNFDVYCNRFWGERLGRRLACIGAWAENHGLEQSADIHLARAIQVTSFLSQRFSNRTTFYEFKDICEKCDLLNPVQKRALVLRYQPEHPIIRAHVEEYLESMNHLYVSYDFPLEEDPELSIPFLIPDEGYLSEMIRYIPKGLLEFVSYLSRIRVGQKELCIFTLQPTSSGFWTVYFKNHQPDTLEIIVIQLRKKNNSMGLSIIAARGVGQDRQGIYIKNVVKNGAAASDGRLQAGDQLLEVDGHSLLDKSQEQAAQLMQRTGPIVTLRVAKEAAIHHNLLDIINNPPTQIQAPPGAITNQNYVPQIPIPHRLSESEVVAPNEQVINYQAQKRRQAGPPVPNIPIQQDRGNMDDYRLNQERLHPSHMRNLNDIPAQIASERQIHFQPTPNIYDESIPAFPITGSSTSPVKSPKKVSWVDNQPHQSLHTLIPPSPSLLSSPSAQIPSPPPEVPSPSELDEATFSAISNGSNGDQLFQQNYQQNLYDENCHEMAHNGFSKLVEINDRHETIHPQEEEPLISRNDDHTINHNNNEPQIGEGFEKKMIPNPTDYLSDAQAKSNSESLTLEDIDEVLSSKTHNTWIEDSAGVIGTQEVYNDPRQRIVKQRERPEATVDVNKEKLTVQEKIRMFSIQNRE